MHGSKRSDRAAGGFEYAGGLRRLRPARGAALTAALITAVSPGRTSAATDTVVRLGYQADPQARCPGEDELRRVVREQLGRDPFRPDAAWHVSVTITRTEGGFEGQILWTEADGRPFGKRILLSRARDCREIAANVAFAVALQLQLVDRGLLPNPGAVTSAGERPGGADERGPRALDATEGPRSPPPVEVQPAATPPPPRTPERAPDEARTTAVPPERVRLAVGAGPAVGVGLTPEAAAFGRMFLLGRLRMFSAEVAADASIPVHQVEPDGTGVRMTALGSSLAGCVHVSMASGCLLGRLGWLRARGTAVTAPSTSWGRFGEIGLRVAGTREWGRLSVRVHADALMMLSRWNVLLNDTVVWPIPRVGALIGVDVAVRFF